MPVAGYYIALVLLAALAVSAAACANRRLQVALLITILSGTVIVPGAVYLNLLISMLGIMLSLAALALAIRELRSPTAEVSTDDSGGEEVKVLV